ncbi:MAG: glycosyltransferase [Clostridia bacterium]|nr:glycosyltransferase [Clostridia bacterium]
MRIRNTQPKYSVIIPVYNAEGTLHRCVGSLFSEHSIQNNSEIILVNDGSSDSSLSICNEYSERYNNVRVIDKQNGGVSSARNAGLDEASGRFILFVDSDDYLTPGCIKIIDEVIDKGCPDLIQFSVRIDNKTNCLIKYNSPLKLQSRKDIMPRIADMMCRKIINAPWAKLYKRSIIEDHHIRFPLGTSVGEDRAFNIVYSFYIESLLLSEKETYVLNTDNNDSLSRKRHKDLSMQLETANEYINNELLCAQLTKEEEAIYRQALNFDTCTGIYNDAKLMIQDRTGWFTRQKRLIQICKKINKQHMKYPKTRYCSMITLPVKLYLTPVIDAIAWKLTRNR